MVLAWASGVKSESARERVREGQLSLVPFFKALVPADSDTVETPKSST